MRRLKNPALGTSRAVNDSRWAAYAAIDRGTLAGEPPPATWWYRGAVGTARGSGISRGRFGPGLYLARSLHTAQHFADLASELHGSQGDIFVYEVDPATHVLFADVFQFERDDLGSQWYNVASGFCKTLQGSRRLDPDDLIFELRDDAELGLRFREHLVRLGYRGVFCGYQDTWGLCLFFPEADAQLLGAASQLGLQRAT